MMKVQKQLKKAYLAALICMFFAGFAASVFARPVSYPKAWTFMQMNDGDMNAVHVHYSPTFKYSLGYKAEYWRDEHWQFHGLQLNYLVNRWNSFASQANFYVKSAAGFAHSDYGNLNDEFEPAAFAGIAADWEDRRYFTSYENRAYYAGDIDKFFTQKARVGIAPYVGDYGDLHTWLMLQLDHAPKKDDEFTLTPMVRLFKDDYMAEAGVSDQGRAMFNFIVRF